MVQIRHCDNHTVVCSRYGQFNSRPRGEWFFVAVCFSPPRKSFGERGAVAPEKPRAAAARCHVVGVQPGNKVARGVAPLARGPLAPLKSRFKEWGFEGGEGNRNPSPPSRPFGYFPGEGKVTRGVGRAAPQGWRRTIFRPHPPGEGRISPTKPPASPSPQAEKSRVLSDPASACLTPAPSCARRSVRRRAGGPAPSRGKHKFLEDQGFSDLCFS